MHSKKKRAHTHGQCTDKAAFYTTKGAVALL